MPKTGHIKVSRTDNKRTVDICSFSILIVIILAQSSETIISHPLHTYYNDVTTCGLDSKTTRYEIRLKLTSSISLLRERSTKGFYIHLRLYI
jgi:hypothetical protein